MIIFDVVEEAWEYPKVCSKKNPCLQVAHASVRGVPVADAVDGRCPRHALLMPPPPQPTPIGYLEGGGGAFAFHYSRYATEFEQLEFIAKGKLLEMVTTNSR